MRILPFLLFFLLLNSCKEETPKQRKINGVSFVATRDAITQRQALAVKQINTNSVALMPFGFIKELDHPEIMFNSERQWFGERKEGIAQNKKVFDSLGIEVMLKPQLWVSHGVFTGDIAMTTEENWQAFETSYKAFVLYFAEVASELNIPIFCLGTELNNFAVNRPDFFKKLIAEVRKVYAGKLTYAENWDVYQTIPFWKDLDFIGIDAYFPLSEEKTPSASTLKKSWKPFKEEMEQLSEQVNKPILFTEYGYRSIDYVAKAPWEHHRTDEQANLKAQQIALTALYETFWDEPWFAGGFLWKWFPNENAGGEKDNRFTVQNKPALDVVKKYYTE
ncbi:glycoside hydrolase family 113 [Joostella sp. CR20]|uniref:glycoside hydrolase family 113 n=1 Tax=Joostella sp. CR20 TaxID=2804312 RepID=UPI00313E0263